MLDVSEPTNGIVFDKPTGQLLVCSTRHAVDRQVFSDLIIVAKVLLRIECIWVLVGGCLLVQLYDILVLYVESC